MVSSWRLRNTLQRQGDSGRFSNNLDASENDVDMTGVSTDRLIIAVDFGTTFSSVAYAKIKASISLDELSLQNVKCIANYPGDRPVYTNHHADWSPQESVPTELWYRLDVPSESVLLENTEPNLPKRGESAANPEPLSDDSDTSSMIGTYDEDIPPKADSSEQNLLAVPSSQIDWGFQIQDAILNLSTPKDATTRLTRFKLLLEKREATKEIRDELQPVLRKLKATRVIEDDVQIITEYLYRLLRHTKEELEAQSVFDDNTASEFVLCVPAVWSSQALLHMQKAMVKSLERCGLWTEGPLDLFIVQEPEAATSWVLAEGEIHIEKDEVIVVLDAGGGTVDAVTYKVANQQPLRLGLQVGTVGTKICGSTIINKEYSKILYEKLQNETYLETKGRTIQSIVDRKTIEFEYSEKKIFDYSDKKYQPRPVQIEHLLSNIPADSRSQEVEDLLREKRKAGLFHNRVQISRKEMTEEIFSFSLKGASKLMQEQLDQAKGMGYAVRAVILVGGFGQSPSLRYFLKEKLEKNRNLLGHRIEFSTPLFPSTAVAYGAVLRAFRKEAGPDREVQCSYGFMRAEPFDIANPAHLVPKAKPRRDEVDRKKYVYSTLYWLIPKGRLLPYHDENKAEVIHVFPHEETELLCRELIYVSDKFHQSHYTIKDSRNKGAILAGTVESEMSFLLKNNLLTPVKSEYGTLYWEVKFELAMIIDGRSMRCEARWPCPGTEEAKRHQKTAIGSKQFCISAAFLPGTE